MFIIREFWTNQEWSGGSCVAKSIKRKYKGIVNTIQIDS